MNGPNCAAQPRQIHHAGSRCKLFRSMLSTAARAALQRELQRAIQLQNVAIIWLDWLVQDGADDQPAEVAAGAGAAVAPGEVVRAAAPQAAAAGVHVARAANAPVAAAPLQAWQLVLLTLSQVVLSQLMLLRQRQKTLARQRVLMQLEELVLKQ